MTDSFFSNLNNINYQTSKRILQSKMQDDIEVILGDYKYTEKYCIGQGSFGKVYKGVNIKTGREVAIKEMDGKQITLQEISSEITILKQLRHQNIVEYQDAFQNNGFFYIVTQYCKGGDLRNVFQDSDQEEQQSMEQKQKKIVKMLEEVCKGFQYLREHNIIHRDLKPSNIMVHEGRYKIGDFGLAKRESVHKSIANQQLIGVPIYMSPQILSKNYYTYKCDVWSLGIIIYEMFFDALPWKSQDSQSLFFNIMRNPYPYVDKKVTKLIGTLLKSTLQYLEKDRLSWAELLKVVRGTSSIDSLKDIKMTKKVSESYSLPMNVHKSIPRYEIQVLNHAYSQAKSIQHELTKLSSQVAYKTFLQTIARYYSQGQSVKSILCDTIYMMLKLCIENLHTFLIQLEALEDGRHVLVFLQLLHDYAYASGQKSQQGFQKKIGLNDGKVRIDEFAAQVISKINTFVAERGDSSEQ